MTGSLPPAVRTSWGEFRILPENRSAVDAVRALASALLKGRRPPVNPIVLHGPTGAGKSLLTAALLKKLSAGPEVITARAVAIGDLARGLGFADRDLATCDVLILEDAQLLPARDADAFCELIDRRVSRRKATIITMNVGPAALRHLPRKLTSRLAAGLVVQLESLSPASRRMILEAAVKQRKLRLTADALDWLAEQSTGGIRPLLGLLGNVAATAKDYPGPLDRNAVQEIIAATGHPSASRVDVPRIVKHVAALFGVTQKELLGPSRLRRVMAPRQVAMYLAREMCGLSLPRLGAAFGRDHTTVLHACRKVEADVVLDAKLGGMVRQLRSELV